MKKVEEHDNTSIEIWNVFKDRLSTTAYTIQCNFRH